MITNRNTKKSLDSTLTPGMSWRDKVLGQGTFRSSCDEDFEFIEGDVTKSNVNGIWTINLSERVQQNLVRDMATTVVVKLLGRNLSYTLLQNRIHTFWKPSQQFHLMDVNNSISWMWRMDTSWLNFKAEMITRKFLPRGHDRARAVSHSPIVDFGI